MKTLILFLLFYSVNAKAQYFIGEAQTVNPGIILSENYVELKLNLKEGKEFDKSNPYTTIYSIGGVKENFQVLLQQDFLGKIHFAALSKNFAAVFNNPAKPMFSFLSCIKNIDPAYETRDILKCILKRLELCLDHLR